jgi:hypothetical protein
VPAGIGLANAIILAIDLGRCDILHGVYHTVSGDLEAPLDNRKKIFRLSKGCYRTECDMRRRKGDTDRRMEKYPGLEKYNKSILSHKVSRAELFEKYLDSFSHFAPALFSLFGQHPIRAMRLEGYFPRQKKHKKIMENIHKGAAIALGDASVCS